MIDALIELDQRQEIISVTSRDRVLFVDNCHCNAWPLLGGKVAIDQWGERRRGDWRAAKSD